MKEIVVEATIENLEKVTTFVNAELDVLNCKDKTKLEIDLAIDEIFSNIVNYAYRPNIGNANIRFDVSDDKKYIFVYFIDTGKQYNPLEKEDPNTKLSLDERQIGGLGIYIVKKSMDDMQYEYKDNQNILMIKKKI